LSDEDTRGPRARDPVTRLRYGLRRLRSADSSLARRLIRLIFGLYFAIAFLVTLALLTVEFRDERDNLRQEANDIIQLVRPALAQAVWDFDRDGVEAITDALARNRAIVGLRLEGVGHAPIVRGQTPATDDAGPRAAPGERPGLLTTLYHQSFPLEHAEYADSSERVGTLSIYSSSDTVIARSGEILSTIVAGAVVKTLALALTLYGVVTRMVGIPLSRVTDRINQFNREMAPPPARAPPAQRPGHRRSELHQLMRSFVAMRRALRASQRQLLSHQHHLEGKVEQRTAELRHQAETDSLTGLLNRRALQARVTALPRELGRREGPENTLVYLDLDNFKKVNDTFGHAAGDDLLQRVAAILQNESRASDWAARLGGDEFVLVLKDCAPEDAVGTVDQICRQIDAAAVEAYGPRCGITASAGVVELEAGGGVDWFSHAMSCADTAAYAAKHAGGNRVQLFSLAQAPISRCYDQNWIALINQALREDTLDLQYTPYSDASGRIAGVRLDTLISCPDGVFTAEQFMPTAERYRRTQPLDLWALERGLAHLGNQPKLLRRLAFVQVAVSADTAGQPEAQRRLRELLEQYPLQGLKLYLRITDDIKSCDVAALGRALAGLEAIGVGVALHDFARLHSPFTQCAYLPVGLVEPAHELLPDPGVDDSRVAALRSLIDFCQRVGVIAAFTGVAAARTRRDLFAWGADFVAGAAVGPTEAIKHLSPTRLAALDRAEVSQDGRERH